MLFKLKKIFFYNGFEADELREIRYELIDVTIDALKKLAIGMGSLYVLAMILERNASYIKIDLIYLAVFSLFLLAVNLFQRTKNYDIAVGASMFFVIAALLVAAYDSTFLCTDSRGVFFLVYVILISVMFTGNPFAIDMMTLVMTIIFMSMSWYTKSPVYFKADVFSGIFTYLISNMCNAMVARTRVKAILKNNEVTKEKVRYQTLFDAVPCGIMEYRLEGKQQQLINMNAQGIQLYNGSTDALNSAQWMQLEQCIHPDDYAQVSECLNSLHHVGDQASFECRLKNRDGVYMWVVGQNQVTGIYEKGMTVLSAFINIDAEKKAINANEAKSKFLSRMSHDIRTPMNAIIGLTDIVLDTPELAPTVKENMLSIKSSSRFLLGLINDVLDVSKIEAGEMTLHPEPYLRDEFINYLNTMIRPLCDQKGLHFTVDAAPTVHPYVLLDKVRFNQIFFNLLSNAVKFTPTGGEVYVHISHTKIEGKIISEKIVIADTGIGMSKAFQARMFEPFVQEDGSHINETQGSGLGLAIVKQIVELMQGTIQVDSAPGEGTTYTIYLDVEICEGKTAEVMQADIRQLAGKTVLLCEDHPINQKIAVTLLAKAGIETEVASDGLQGLDMFKMSKAGHYDAVLMDIRMPVMGGLEAATNIRACMHPDAATIPIIAMTANAFDTDREKSIAAGMNEHISKPIDAKVLYATLAQFTCGNMQSNKTI